ncbi:hypothetical protein JXA47_04095 [Candidatus Sumerlaeota bacterium]|nr:hypothetical protein [Candidatus Sumerlaeota bacterium]
MAEPITKDQRRVPRIERLDEAVQFSLGAERLLSNVKLRDLAINSLRVEIPGEFSLPGGRRMETDVEAHIPGFGLYLRCRSRIARTYALGKRGPAVRGVALELLDLHPSARGQIRSLYPPETQWPASMA